YTRTEAERIAPRLGRYAGQKPLVYLGKRAREGVVKGLRGPRALVLSTHAFFLAEPASRGPARAGGRAPARENPLLRCGVLLAGCNRRKAVRPGEEDGILTGLEVVGC